MQNTKNKFKNIAISGGVGVGKTTLLKNLRAVLGRDGWDVRSSGQIIRDYTKEKIRPHASLVPDSLHTNIEDAVYSVLKNEEKQAVEGWLAGFISRKLPHVLRVLLVCSDMSLQVDRVMNRDLVSAKEAKSIIFERQKENFNTWKRIYGDYDFFNPSFFHLVIDTYSSGPMETVGKVLDALGGFVGNNRR